MWESGVLHHTGCTIRDNYFVKSALIKITVFTKKLVFVVIYVAYLAWPNISHSLVHLTHYHDQIEIVAEAVSPALP